MMKKLGVYLLSTAAALFVMTAQMGVSPNCVWSYYKPEIPEILKD